MTEKALSVKELYELLKPLINEYGDLEVRVSYDSGLVATEIKNKEPKIVLKPMRDYSYVIFEGY
jgi:hypothetical protein